MHFLNDGTSIIFNISKNITKKANNKEIGMLEVLNSKEARQIGK